MFLSTYFWQCVFLLKKMEQCGEKFGKTRREIELENNRRQWNGRNFTISLRYLYSSHPVIKDAIAITIDVIVGAVVDTAATAFATYVLPAKYIHIYSYMPCAYNTEFTK